MKKRIFDLAAVLVIAACGAGPAMAGSLPTPAPVVGAGIGGVVLIGAGYRLLRRKIGR